MKYVFIFYALFLTGFFIDSTAMEREGRLALTSEVDEEAPLLEAKKSQEKNKRNVAIATALFKYDRVDDLKQHLKNIIDTPEQLADIYTIVIPPALSHRRSLDELKARFTQATPYVTAFEAIERTKNRQRLFALHCQKFITPGERAALLNCVTSTSFAVISFGISLLIAFNTRISSDDWNSDYLKCFGQNYYKMDACIANPLPFKCPSSPDHCCVQPLQSCCQKTYDCCYEVVPNFCQNQLNHAAKMQMWESFIPFFCTVGAVVLAQIALRIGARCKPRNTPERNQLTRDYKNALITLQNHITEQQESLRSL